jgi:hypothetical protein
MAYTISTFIKATNFSDLKDQKLALLEAIAELEKTNPERAEKLEGLLNFLDGFQDMCVDSYGVDPNIVFVRDPNEEETDEPDAERGYSHYETGSILTPLTEKEKGDDDELEKDLWNSPTGSPETKE